MLNNYIRLARKNLFNTVRIRKSLLSYKPESTTDLIIRDVIYQCRARDVAREIIQYVGLHIFSCLLCFCAVICTKEGEMIRQHLKFFSLVRI